jgi:ribonuclease HI
MGVTAADGGITPEENDDLRREKRETRKQSNDRNLTKVPGHTEDTHNVEC